MDEPPDRTQFTDASSWVLMNFTRGSMWMDDYERQWGVMNQQWNLRPETQLLRANATYRRILSLYGTVEWFWPALIILCVSTLLTIAWMVRALPLRTSGFKRDDKHPLPTCWPTCTPFFRCRDRKPSKISYDDILTSAEKVLDSCKLISVFFIFLTPSAIAQNACDTPSALLKLPGYSITTIAPTYLSGAKLDLVRFRTVLGYTNEQYHALVALYATAPDPRYFFALYILEVFSTVIFIGSWGAVRKERWATFYATGALVMAILWLFYETQMYTRVTLLDSGEAFLCVIPYLNIYTRAFGILHLVITSYYYGLALGCSSLRLPFLLHPHGRHQMPSQSTASAQGSSEDVGVASETGDSMRPDTTTPSGQSRTSHSGDMQKGTPRSMVVTAAHGGW